VKAASFAIQTRRRKPIFSFHEMTPRPSRIRLNGLYISPVADNQHTMPIDNAIRRRHFENIVLPPHIFGPAEAPADRPLPVERAFDSKKLLLGQSRLWIPRLDPMQPEPGIEQFQRVIHRFLTGF